MPSTYGYFGLREMVEVKKLKFEWRFLKYEIQVFVMSAEETPKHNRRSLPSPVSEASAGEALCL